MNAELYFVGRFKDGYLLFITHGPFFEQHVAQEVCDNQSPKKERCYWDVIKVELPFTVVGVDE